jgi:hypothetical protein
MGEVALPMQRVVVDSIQESRMLHGQSAITVAETALSEGELVAAHNLQDELVAIGEVAAILRPGGPVEIRPRAVLKEL